MRSLVVLLAFSALPVLAQDRPNILFAISDDQSWMHASAYGDRGTITPAFDRVAREGALFHYAYTAAPSCAPSRSAILTGRNIWELEEGGILIGMLRSKFGVFTHRLQDAGYQIGATGKTWGPGIYGPDWERPVYAKILNDRKLPAAEQRPGLSAIDYAANFDDFLAGRDSEKPFFFWLGTTEPHQRYDVDAWKRAGKNLEDARLPSWLPDDPVTRGEILDYGVEIEHFDSHLARVLAALEKAGQLENTLVVVTSDHGNPLPRSKCNLYDGGVRVPLAVRWPGQVPAGREIDDFISLVDVAPTLLEAAGLEVPRVMSGRSFLDVLKSNKSGQVDPSRDFVVTAFERHTDARRGGVGYPMRSIRTHRWAYIRNYEPDRWPAGDPDLNARPQGIFGDVDRGASKTFLIANAQDPKVAPYYLMSFGRRPAEEFYDMEKDPDQMHNLAKDPEFAAEKARLAYRLLRYLNLHNDPRMRGENPWDHYPFFRQF